MGEEKVNWALAAQEGIPMTNTETCTNLMLSADQAQRKLISVQRQLKKFDNVKLRHLMNLENDFSETKTLLKALSQKVEEISEPIANLTRSFVSYPETTYAQFCKIHQRFLPCPQEGPLCEFIIVKEEVKK